MLALLDIRRICTEGYIWILTHILMWKSCPLIVTSSHLKYFLWHIFVSFKVKPRTVTLVSFSTERLLPDESLNLPDSLPLLPQLSGGWGGKDNDDDDGGGLSLTWNRQWRWGSCAVRTLILHHPECRNFTKCRHTITTSHWCCLDLNTQEIEL